MARTRSTELAKPRSKNSAAVEELNRGIEKLQSLKALVEDLRGEGFPYRDAVRARTELQIRDAIKRLFGDRSPEYQENKGHRLRTSSQGEIGETIQLLNKLIGNLENRKMDLLGLRPTPPSEQPTTQPTAPAPQTPVLTLVPPVATAPAAATQPTGVATAPPVSPTLVHQIPPAAPVAVAPPVLPLAAIHPVTQPTYAPTPVAVQQAQVARESAPVVPPPSTPPASVDVARKVTQAAPAPPPEVASSTVAPAKLSPGQRSDEDDSLAILRKVCSRFHIVARQLRLRKEYRATLEVEDDYDAQDLFFALLRLEFDEVGSEDWVPRYSEGATRTGFLLNKGNIVVVVKKTRPGLTTRDIQDQLRIDSERFSSQRGHVVLFCFVYDPEGRIGNPTGFEAEVTSFSSRYRIELMVAPK
jgi:hypothetical protein